jgi:transforming growth factor-beta-induced protein
LIKLDIDAVNGVIHVIDRVMLPQARRNVGANDAKKMIEVAVTHGVSLYNRGHHAACARVYEQTARQLVKHGDDLMPPLAMQNLSSALAKTQHTQCATTNSWTLRRGLDNVYRNLRMADRR